MPLTAMNSRVTAVITGFWMIRIPMAKGANAATLTSVPSQTKAVLSAAPARFARRLKEAWSVAAVRTSASANPVIESPFFDRRGPGSPFPRATIHHGRRSVKPQNAATRLPGQPVEIVRLPPETSRSHSFSFIFPPALPDSSSSSLTGYGDRSFRIIHHLVNGCLIRFELKYRGSPVTSPPIRRVFRKPDPRSLAPPRPPRAPGFPRRKTHRSPRCAPRPDLVTDLLDERLLARGR